MLGGGVTAKGFCAWGLAGGNRQIPRAKEPAVVVQSAAMEVLGSRVGDVG